MEKTCNSCYCKSYYKTLANNKINIKFDAKSECGMGGPIYGTLKIDKHLTNDFAFGQVVFYEENKELAYLSWNPTNGGAKTILHVYNTIEEKDTKYELLFGAYKISKIDKDLIVIENEFDGVKTNIKRV